ncbi:SAM-dependent methyltransferase [Cupriavidus pauculus]|uniref:SAM-dependent methyltransferase n=1 Tax=Cupriavidus pauculus TaxID=82633 RepID=UPI001EE284C1|nr:SAM-dependent methyltransferase [Cupriavidus pauculus]GJG94247.1 methyltransferase domain-containing protein [Cupriavidus pauculus]
MSRPDFTEVFTEIFDQDDPWGLESLWYEARKRDLLVAALPEARYARALEAGCATGMLTERLAARCDALLAVDVMPRAIERTRARLQGTANVQASVAQLPADWPAGRFDLIVLSELGYYFDPADWQRTAELAAAALTPTGTLVACHYQRQFADRRMCTEDVHAAVAGQPGLHHHVHHLEPDFLLEVWSRNPQPLRLREPIL